MAQTWLLYGPNNLTLIGIPLFGLRDYLVKILAISVIWKQRYCRNSQNMALIWQKHGTNMSQTWPLYGLNTLTSIGILLFGLHDSLVKI